MNTSLDGSTRAEPEPKDEPVRDHLDKPPLTADPAFHLPPEIAARWGARVLNPSTAIKTKDQRPIRPTVYIGDRLLVSGSTPQHARERLTQAARELDLELKPPVIRQRRLEQVRDAATRCGASDADTRFATVHRLEPIEGFAADPDAWRVLQTYRAPLDHDDESHRHVSLDHLMTAANGPAIDGAPYVEGHGIGGAPYVEGHGLGGAPYVEGHGYGSSVYGMPGWGGRQPITVVARRPARDAHFPGRRPVVVVLDTGLGRHDWFADGSATLVPDILSVPIEDPEITGVTGSHAEQLDPDAGHGTFIAGVIRQEAPDADVRVYRIMGGDGVVPESNLLEVLNLLAVQQEAAVAEGGDANAVVDILSLSLGYYHEQPADLAYDPLLLEPLQRLGRAGVTTVVAAGNDSTDRPMYPAAFTPWAHGRVTATDPNCLPVISVGALNPNGSTALFSNCGEWVTCERAGASLVSTFPTTIDGPAQPVGKIETAGEAELEAIEGQASPDYAQGPDPDDFRSGFAVWSGTSFAGPVLAGELATKLCDAARAAVQPETGGGSTPVERSWAAVSACVPKLQP